MSIDIAIAAPERVALMFPSIRNGDRSGSSWTRSRSYSSHYICPRALRGLRGSHKSFYSLETASAKADTGALYNTCVLRPSHSSPTEAICRPRRPNHDDGGSPKQIVD